MDLVIAQVLDSRLVVLTAFALLAIAIAHSIIGVVTELSLAESAIHSQCILAHSTLAHCHYLTMIQLLSLALLSAIAMVE